MKTIYEFISKSITDSISDQSIEQVLASVEALRVGDPLYGLKTMYLNLT